MFQRRQLALALLSGLTLQTPIAVANKKPAPPEVLSVTLIWDRGPHNAFTDLARLNDRWFVVFREGAAHVSPDGKIRVLSSVDGEVWSPWAELSHPVADLRDPKLTVTPDHRLMLTAAGSMHPPSDAKHKTFVWFSTEGRDWTPVQMIGEPNLWLWRVTWYQRKAYGMGYSTDGKESFVRPYFSQNGRVFQPLAASALSEGSPNETSILFSNDDEALCIVRREAGPKTAMLGRSRPPYRGWQWNDLGVRIGGPHMIRLPDRRIVAAGRLYDGQQRTSLCWLDPERNSLMEFLKLPSSGDSSYPGLVWHDDQLWVSYYSSHEGRASIYLARVRIPF